MLQETLLANDALQLRVTPAFGCHWTSLKIRTDGAWLDLLHPIPRLDLPARRWGGFGNYVLAPWSNRIRQGVFRFRGREYRVHMNMPDRTAIHGDVMTRPWKVTASRDTALEAALDSADFPDFNFPFPLRFRLALSLEGSRLTTRLAVENAGSEPAPAGLGFHPYFKRRLTPADPDVELAVPVGKVYPAERCIPTAPPVPVSGKLDLRRPARLGKRGLDHCFTGRREGPAILRYPGSRVEVALAMDPVFSHVVVYAPDTFRGWGPPKPFVCVEPVTHVNDGFNLLDRGWEGTGVRVLDPGESLEGAFELKVGRF